MKYKRGTFMVVPNIKYLRGKSPYLQTIFLWICQHTDENGICYPSRDRLASECGCDIRSIDRWIKVLEEDGVIIKTKRKKPKSKENASNVYQVIITEKNYKTPDFKSLPSDDFKSLGSDSNVPTGSDSNVPVTISNNNYNQLTILKKSPTVKEIPYSFEESMKLLNKSEKTSDKVISLYFYKKGFKFKNQSQFNTEFKRNVKPAVLLEGYSSKELEETMEYCEEKYPEIWTLETVVKRVAQVVTKK